MENRQEETITLRDLDVELTNGSLRITLYPQDELLFRDNGDIEVVYAELPKVKPPRRAEHTVIRGRHLQCYSLRERQMEVKKENVQ